MSLHHAFISVIHWLCNTLSTIPLDKKNEIDNLINNQTLLSPLHQHEHQHRHQHQEYSAKTISTSSLFLNMPLPTRESIILNHILTLTDRSHLLNLPLTLPLYQLICTLIARHGGNHNSNISVLLLDWSKLARDSLTAAPLSSERTTSFQSNTNGDNHNMQEIIDASFFSNALKELLHRNQIRDMIELFHGMRNIHHIHKVDLNTGIALLSLLKDKIDVEIKQKEIISAAAIGVARDPDYKHGDDDDGDDDFDNKCTVFDETDAIELAMLLQEPVMEELNMKKKELQGFQFHDTFEYMFDKNDDDQDFDEDSEEWDDNSVYDDEDYDLDDHDDTDTKVHLNSSTGELEKVEFRFDLHSPSSNVNHLKPKSQGRETYHKLIKDMVYIRDATWEIPDLVPQLEKWNGNTGLFFTKWYEKELLKEIRNENDGFDEDDNVV